MIANASPTSSLLSTAQCTCYHNLEAHLPTLVAGRDIIANASSASSLLNTGVPSPLGHLRTTHVTSPPQDSPRVRTLLMAACVRASFARRANVLMAARKQKVHVLVLTHAVHDGNVELHECPAHK
eukprot:scaffold60226_cov19-Tisochrysis_lutea.AAC.1